MRNQRRKWRRLRGGSSISSGGSDTDRAVRQLQSHITVRREKRAIEEFERKNRTTGGVGTLRGWITLKKESEKNRAAAVEDMRRAMEAVKVAEDKVFAIGDRLVEEERQLQVGYLNFIIWIL